MNVQNGGFWMLVSCLVVLLGFEPITNTTIFAEEVGLTGLRDGNRWTIPLAPVGPTRIPRVFASIRSATFQNMPNAAIVVHPEIEFWELRYEGAPKSPSAVIEFDSPPLLQSECPAIKQAGDGTITLACSQGITVGEKLRFEPQPHKNTIGYWAVAGDHVSWNVDVEQPFDFNVGILQGCGPNGGGTAKVSLLHRDKRVDSFEFEVKTTGHFQNFVWRNVGKLAVKEPGQYVVRIEAVKISDAALMDVRQLHLSPKR